MSDFWRDVATSDLWRDFWQNEEVQRIYRYWTDQMKTAADLRALGLAQGHIQAFEALRDLPERMAVKESRKKD